MPPIFHQSIRTRRAARGQCARHSIIITMAKRCEICGKGPVVGRNISHAHNVTARRFEPNLQRVRAIVNGGIRRLRVCTRCLRSNKVTKAA
jgi:large subunit ribosomal protein L28